MIAVAMTLYREGFDLDYQLSMRDGTVALPSSFPDPSDAQTGSTLSLHARCIDNTGTIYTTRNPNYSLGHEYTVFFRSIFSPAIGADAKRLLIQVAGLVFIEYDAERGVRANHPLDGVHFEFDVDLTRLVEYQQAKGPGAQGIR